MTVCYLDIETGPTRDPAVIKRLQDAVKPPGQYKKADSIATWYASEGAAAKEEAVARTALSGTYGRIVSVALAIGNDEVTCEAGDDEVALLNWVKGAVQAFAPEQFVAFNGEFDFRFIRQRAIINRVKMPYLPLSSRDFYDPMREWAGYREYISMAELESALGIERVDPITGADVGKYLAVGDFETIKHHNIVDVENLREIFKRMNL